MDTAAQLRVDLACALRWAARMGLNEGVDNHFSAAVPEADGTIRGDKFLINPFGWHWSEITASSLVLCDAEGTVLEGSETVEATAFCIHSRIHVNHPSAAVVLHTHQPYATALTLIEGGRLEMVEQNALMFDDRIAYDDDYEGLALATEEGIASLNTHQFFRWAAPCPPFWCQRGAPGLQSRPCRANFFLVEAARTDYRKQLPCWD